MQETTRVVIEFSSEFEYQTNRLHAPERIYFDFPKSKLRTGLRSIYSKEFAGETISRVRIAQPASGMTRVVLDLLEDVDVSTEKFKNPFRLLIELRPKLTPTSQIRANIPPAADSGPKLTSSPGATPLKPMKLETNGTEPAPVQAQPALSRRYVLKLSPATAAPGGVAEVRLELDSPTGVEPQALQWELSYPSPKLGLEDVDLVASSVASSAGKSLVCAGRVESAAEYVYRCILAGGLELIPNGAVAVVNFHVRSHAEPGPATVQISNALAVPRDGNEVPIQPSEVEITIR